MLKLMIVCDKCHETYMADDDVCLAVARQMAARRGWIAREDCDLCPDCKWKWIASSRSELVHVG